MISFSCIFKGNHMHYQVLSLLEEYYRPVELIEITK